GRRFASAGAFFSTSPEILKPIRRERRVANRRKQSTCRQSKRRLTAFKRPSRAGAVLYTSTCPATNVFMPAASTSWTCTKTSGPPSSGRMKPNPRSVLKNLTRPVGIFSCSSSAQWTPRPSDERRDERRTPGAAVRRVRGGSHQRVPSSSLGSRGHAKVDQGYVGTATELRQPVIAMSLGGLRAKVEALMSPDDVIIVLKNYSRF